MQRATQWLIMLWLTCALPTTAREHFASTVQEFEAGLHSVVPGDEIILRKGPWRDARLHFRAKGEPDRPLTVRPETLGQVIFEGASQLIIDGPHLVVTGLKFQNNSNATETV